MKKCIKEHINKYAKIKIIYWNEWKINIKIKYIWKITKMQ